MCNISSPGTYNGLCEIILGLNYERCESFTLAVGLCNRLSWLAHN